MKVQEVVFAELFTNDNGPARIQPNKKYAGPANKGGLFVPAKVAVAAKAVNSYSRCVYADGGFFGR
jgi:hypothetical protein